MPPATLFAGLSAGDSPAPPFLARGGPAYSWRMPGWSSKLTRPVVIKGGPLLRTLGDVRAFMIAEARMPEARMPRIAIIKPACSALLILLSISAVPQEAARADAASGQLLFNNACRTCHTMKEGDNRLGPNLHNIIGRKAGSLPDYGYSSAMKGADFVWDREKLDSFIAKPDEVVPGNNMKPYGGLASAEDRSKLIAFLQSPGTN